MKKVLIIAKEFYPNNTGFAHAAVNLVKSIKMYDKKDDYQLHIFTDTKLGQEKELQNVNVIRFDSKFSSNEGNPLLLMRNIMKYKFLKRFIEKENIDVIFFETNIHHLLVNLIQNKFNDKVVVRLHSTIDTEVLMDFPKSLPGKVFRKMTLNFMKKAENIVSTNPYHLDFTKNRMFNSNEYITWENKGYFLLPNTLIQEKEHKSSKREDYILTLGKLSRQGYIQKGLPDLLKAVYLLHEYNQIPKSFKLKLIGQGEMESEIKNLIKKLNIGEYIDLIPSTTHQETLSLIKEAKAVVLVSRYEGQSMFLTEALALGKTLITTKETGVSHMVKEGYNGFLVNKGDYKDIAEKLIDLYKLSDQTIEQYEENSFELFNNEFSPKEVYRNFELLVKFMK